MVDVEKISKVPIAMFSGKYDRIVKAEENEEFAQRIPAVIKHE